MDEKQKEILSVCLIGAGKVGSVHLHSMLERPDKFRITGIVDDHPSKDAQQAMQCNTSLLLYPTSDVDIPMEKAEAVVIATPTFLHEFYITKALHMGKHVFCEKPLVPTVEAVAKVYELGKQHS